jgi:hypothetical protein
MDLTALDLWNVLENLAGLNNEPYTRSLPTRILKRAIDLLDFWAMDKESDMSTTSALLPQWKDAISNKSKGIHHDASPDRELHNA